jgi:HAD superfamily hydrolase (TIGR01509 family)
MATRGVIFDMDGVLIDSGAHHRAAWTALLEELGVTPTAPEWWRLSVGRPAEEAVPLLLERSLSPDEARTLARRKRELYGTLSARGTQPVPGVPEFVASLRRLGIPRAVATSATRPDVDRLLTELGLLDRFDVIITAENVRFGKPDPEVYLRAAEGLGLAPPACLVFEDSLVGVRAARTAGMRVIGVSTAHTDAELSDAGAERVIASFVAVAWPV